MVDEDRGRWVGVKLAMTGLEGVPPIEVYRLGDAYFVKDGNHRVSVARQLGSKYIQAYVTPVHVRVPFGPDVDRDGLIIASELAAFLEETHLDELRPVADLRVTVPGQYPTLLEHIRVHRLLHGHRPRPAGRVAGVGGALVRRGLPARRRRHPRPRAAGALRGPHRDRPLPVPGRASGAPGGGVRVEHRGAAPSGGPGARAGAAARRARGAVGGATGDGARSGAGALGRRRAAGLAG
ncbi:MAG: hypothetical protein M5U09_23090 [Gammaproteobacteria bacterium]|nr:hypothetical protein [Gammaproteobacteria bacterium]